jgi:DNA-binding NtrC family response regulator
VSSTVEVLTLESDGNAVRVLHETLRRHNRAFRVTHATNPDAALAILDVRPVQLLLVDLDMPGAGLAFLQVLRERWSQLPVLVTSERDSARAAVRALRAGARDYLLRPLDMAELVHSVDEVVRSLRTEPEHRKARAIGSISFSDIIGDCDAMREVYEHIATVRNSKIAVFVGGETGTGKELVTRAIHRAGPRASSPFVAINCGAIPEHLQESELFGHERGAFTGATASRTGRFEQAQGGTLFLDEVGELSAGAQVRLLRVLQDGTFTRVGGTDAMQSDVRIISATHRDLKAMVAAGEFREDLYYRLIVYPIHVPALRERGSDIRRLVAHMIHKFGPDVGHPVEGLTPEAFDCVECYAWPGNVRELENVVHRAMLLASGGLITKDCLPAAIRGDEEPRATVPRVEDLAPDPTKLSLADAEKHAIERALEAAGGNVTRAAKKLGIARATIYRKMQRLGVAHPRSSD